jgi:hypothetical protein
MWVRAELSPEPIHRNLELELTHRGENRNSLTTIACLKRLNHTLLVELGNAFSELLVTGGVEIASNPEMLRGERGNRWELDDAVDTEAVPDPQLGCVDQAHHVSRKRDVDGLPVSAEDLMCVFGRERTTGAMIGEGHPPLEPSRADPHEGDPVAMPGIEVGLNLEDESGQIAIERYLLARCTPYRLRRGCQGGDGIEQEINPEIP